MRSCIVIPAYQPEDILVAYVLKLLDAKVGPVLVVDDGSRESCRPIFDRLAGLEDCTVLHHPVNRGKGAALKTAIHWYRTHPRATTRAAAASSPPTVTGNMLWRMCSSWPRPWKSSLAL